MSHMTYPEAAVIGLIQGVTELFPVSSLGHSVLIPALIGGSWAKDLNAAAPSRPTWPSWSACTWPPRSGCCSTSGGTGCGSSAASSARSRTARSETADERLAWMIILATIPVGLVGVVADHETRVLFAKPVLAGVFLIINGAILFAGERFRPQRQPATPTASCEEQEAASSRPGRARRQAARPGGAHASGQRAVRQQELSGGRPGRRAAGRHGLRAGHR